MITDRFHDLRDLAYEANMLLAKSGLIILTWGNVSAVDRANGVFAIKPSGVPYDKLKPEDIVIVSLETGEKIDGAMNPSSDTPTHRILYNSFESIGGICHCHSVHATAFAQASIELKCLGTTHADVFYGNVPVTRRLKQDEIDTNYEGATGDVIVESFTNLDPMATPGVLVRQHGPFTWGKSAIQSVENAQVLEETAHIAFVQSSLGQKTLAVSTLKALDKNLLNKHYLRKHGKNATYGQGSDH